MEDKIVLEPERVMFPRWVFNYVIGDSCPFQLIPTEILPPACISPTFGKLPMVLQITGEPEPVVASSLRRGIFLTVKQIQSIMDALHFDGPAPGSGSGKKGRLVKLDYATCLINHLFPTVNENETAFMVTSLMVKKQVRPEDAPELLVKLISMLDTSEAQHFSRMRKEAVDDLAVSAMKDKISKVQQKKAEKEEKAKDGKGVKRTLDAPEESQSSKVKQPRLTPDHSAILRGNNVRAPPEFLKLFPLISHCYFKWLPQNTRVTVEFVQKERFLIVYCAVCVFFKAMLSQVFS